MTKLRSLERVSGSKVTRSHAKRRGSQSAGSSGPRRALVTEAPKPKLGDVRRLQLLSKRLRATHARLGSLLRPRAKVPDPSWSELAHCLCEVLEVVLEDFELFPEQPVLCLCGHGPHAHANAETACNAISCCCNNFSLDYESVKP
jgi:hypothetical protein